MNLQLDIMCRLQILEGAAGVPFGTWHSQGSRALLQARDFFQDRHSGVHADWFSSKSKGVYASLLKYVRHAFSLQPQGEMDEEDILQRALTGLSLSSEKEVQPLFYSSGMCRKALLFKGDDPRTVVFAGTHLLLVRRARDAIKVNRHTVPGAPVPDEFEDIPLELVSDIRMTTLLRDKDRLMEAIDFLDGHKHRGLCYILTDYLQRDMPVLENLMTNSDAADYFGVTKQTLGGQIKDSWRALADLMDTWPMADQSPQPPCCI